MESPLQIISRQASRTDPTAGKVEVDASGTPLKTSPSTLQVDAQLSSTDAAKKHPVASGNEPTGLVDKVSSAIKSAVMGESKVAPTVTNNFGIPVGDLFHSYNVNGIVAAGDSIMSEQQQTFNRSKVVERAVHACGSGAFGSFTVTKDVSRWTKAKFLQPGMVTPLFCRFSTVTYGREFPDSARNPRGMAVKFYTEDGNYDILMINFPVFFCRDPALGPSVIRSQQRNPMNFQVNLDSTFDFMSLVPESSLCNLWFWSDHGTPVGWRHFDAYPCHTFRWVNTEGAAVWVRYVFKTKQGLKNFSFDEAVRMCGEDPDFAKRDLWADINKGGTPSWVWHVQVLTDDELSTLGVDPFDTTKEWPESKAPLHEVGTLVLDRNPENYHRDVEQAVFSPGRIVPGIELSPDPLLQFRSWFYADAQLYRIGVNYHQVPVNCPFMAKNFHPFSRDGMMRVDTNGGSEANYFPNSFGAPMCARPDPRSNWSSQPVHGVLSRAAPARSDEGSPNEYQQATAFYTAMSEEDKQHLHYNIAKGFAVVSRVEVKLRFLMQAYQVHPDLVQGVLASMKSLNLAEDGLTFERVKSNAEKHPHTVDQRNGYAPYPLE